MTDSTAPATLADALARRPLNWADMGSSARDSWEDRVTRDWHKRNIPAIPVETIRPGARIKHRVSDDTFSVSNVGDWYTDPLGFYVWNKHNGHADVAATDVLEVLCSPITGQPADDLYESGLVWVKVTA